jgi:Flp pilus assembly pilin Flp
MRTFMQAVHQRALNHSKQFGRRLGRDESGVTAIEFAMVGLPFFMMLFGIMTVGLYFFSVFNLENAVETAARPFRTGAAGTKYPLTNATVIAQSKSNFKKDVCDQLAPFFDCSKLRIRLVNVTLLQKTTPGELPTVGKCLVKSVPTATSPDILVPLDQTEFNGVQQSDTVVLTACYEMDLLKSIPFMNLGNMPSGAMMLQAATAFKAEPF